MDTGTLSGTAARLAQHAGFGAANEEQKQIELRRHLHRVRFYLHGNHYVLNQRHTSMFLIPGDHPVRLKLFRIVDSTAFTVVIALFIVMNAVITILDTPGIRQLSGLTDTLLAFDILFQVVFTLELFLKFAVLGICAHRHSFFRSPQNAIDFIVVAVGFIVFFVESYVTKRLVRLVRAARAVGFLSRVPLLRSIFVAVRRALVPLRDILLLMTFVIAGMAVLGLDVFVGTFQQKCYVDVISNSTTNATALILDPAVQDMRCSLNPNSGHECKNPGTRCETHKDIFEQQYLSYQHIGEAILVVFKMVTMDNWPADLKVIQEANGVTWFLYCFVIVLFGGFFAMNLVLAILSGEYEEVTAEQEERDRKRREMREKVIEAQHSGVMEKSAIEAGVLAIGEELKAVHMSEEEAAAALAAEFEDSTHDVPHGLSDAKCTQDSGTTPSAPEPDDLKSPGSPGLEDADGDSSPRRREPVTGFRRMRRLLWRRVVHTKGFRALSLIVTSINILVLATDHYGIDSTWQAVNNWINFVCSVFFIIEAILKITAMLTLYFRDPFNDFDLLLCIVSIPEMVLAGDAGSGSSLSALRAFRLARVMRVVNSSPAVRQILITVGNAAVSSAFLFLFLAVYVTIGGLFCVIVFPDAVSEDVRPNYVNFPNALLANFIVLSGENWVDEAVKVMSGTTPWAVAYFVTYFIFGNYVILNFVVVILIASYNDAAEEIVAEDETQAEQMQFDTFAENARRERRSTLEGSSFQTVPSSTVVAAKPPAARAGDRPTDTRPKDADDVDVFASGVFASEGLQSVDVDCDDSRGVQRVSVAGRMHPENSDATTPPAVVAPVSPAKSGADTVASSPRLQGSGAPSFRQFAENTTQPHNDESDDDNPNAEPALPADGTKASFLQMKLRALKGFSFRTALASAFGMAFDEQLEERIEGRSLKIFSKENPIRRFCVAIVTSPYFELLVVVVVVQSCIALALDNKKAREDDSFANFLDFNTIFMFAFFALECLLKWLAYGVIIGEHAYFRDKWNVLDFVILIFSLVALFVPLQAAQALRIFRLASKWSAMRVVIASLAAAVPGIANVFALVAFFFLVAGILGVQIWNGRFATCTDPDVTQAIDCIGFFNSTSTVVVERGGQFFETQEITTAPRYWLHSFYNFNHLGKAALSLTVIMYGDGWSGILYNAMDVTDDGRATSPNASYWWGIVVVLLLVIGNFFLNNLFVGSLMDSFSHERKLQQGVIDTSGHKLLTEGQEKWIREYRFALSSKLPLIVPKPTFPVRRFMVWLYFKDKLRLDARPAFEVVITILILLNALLLCTIHADQPKTWSDFIDGANLFFAIAFTVEFVIKIIAMRPRAYFGDSWTSFDFLLLIAAWLGIVFAETPGTNALRVLRVARVLRLVKKARGLYRLFQSLIYALPQLVNVSFFLALVLYVFGVAGTQLFQSLYWDDTDGTVLGRFFNFEEVWRSMMLLFQIGTGEAWADVLDYANIDQRNSGCSEAAGTCGTPLSYPFFILFMLCANSVAINLFIFIVVDNYMEVNEISGQLSQFLLQRLERFRRLWVSIDVDRTGRIRWESFVVIVRQMHLTLEQEWDDFIDDWGDEPVDLDGDGVADDSASDVSDDDRPASAGAPVRPTTADFRSDRVVNVFYKMLGMRDFNATSARREHMHSRLIDMPANGNELHRYFLKKIAAMRVPVSSPGTGDDSESHGGLVVYEDCVMGIVREFYHIDDDHPLDDGAKDFLSAQVDYSEDQVFMVHHAMAVAKILSAYGKVVAERSQRFGSGSGHGPAPTGHHVNTSNSNRHTAKPAGPAQGNAGDDEAVIDLVGVAPAA